MSLIKFYIVVILLICSSQALALFMPAGVQVNTDTEVNSNDVGC